MQGTKGSSYQFGVVAILIQVQQGRFQIQQNLPGFLAERLFILVNHPEFPWAEASSSLAQPLQSLTPESCQNLPRRPHGRYCRALPRQPRKTRPPSPHPASLPTTTEL